MALVYQLEALLGYIDPHWGMREKIPFSQFLCGSPANAVVLYYKE